MAIVNIKYDKQKSNLWNIENPTKEGFENRFWYSPKYDPRYDPQKRNYDIHNFGMKKAGGSLPKAQFGWKAKWTSNYNDWIKTVPKDRQGNNYNLKKAYYLAPKSELEVWRNSSVKDLKEGKNHLTTSYENQQTGEYEFMKSYKHPTLSWEMQWYNSKDGEDFRNDYDLVTTKPYYKYVPKKPVWQYQKGGEIQKGQSGWKAKWTTSQSQKAVKDWGRRKMEDMNQLISQAASEADKKLEQRQKAYLRANKNVHAPMLNNTAKLQEALWNIGAYKGLKDKRGRDIVFNTVVDGMLGPVTEKAIQKAKEMGYNVDIQSGHINKTKTAPIRKPRRKGLATMREMTHAASTGGMDIMIPLMKKGEDSHNTNLQAIFDHKNRFNIKNNYGVVDKKNKTLSIYAGDSLLERFPVTLGKNIGDMAVPSTVNYLKASPRTTGAGVFTLSSRPTSIYLGHEPLFFMYSDKTGRVSQALHSPAGPNRLIPFKNPNASKRVSYGCVSGNCGVVKHLYQDKILTDNDTIYVLPEVDGNTLIEKNGKLQMSWKGNNPTTYIDENGITRQAYYNNRM